MANEAGPWYLRVARAVGEWGYSQEEVADYLRLHYSCLSRIMSEREKSIRKSLNASVCAGGKILILTFFGGPVASHMHC